MLEKISSVDYVSDGVLQALFDALNFHFSPVVLFYFFVFFNTEGGKENLF